MEWPVIGFKERACTNKQKKKVKYFKKISLHFEGSKNNGVKSFVGKVQCCKLGLIFLKIWAY
jgi:hypothetical protein